MLSPRLDNVDSDLLSGFDHNDLVFGENPHIPLESQSVFPPPSAGPFGGLYNQPGGFATVQDTMSELAPSNLPAQSWGFGGLSFSDRMFIPTDNLIMQNNVQPVQTRVITTPNHLDLRSADIKSAPRQDHWKEILELSTKIGRGHNILEPTTDATTSGIEALRLGLMATFRVKNQRPLSDHDVQLLLFRGRNEDPVLSNGQLSYCLTAQQLQTALYRYGVPRNEHYKLGIVCYAEERFQFEVSFPPNATDRDDQIIVWVFEEPLNCGPSIGRHKSSRWSAIAPRNMISTPKNYAQALTSPTPPPETVVAPVDTSLLFVERPGTSSSHTESQSGSSSSSAPVKCCKKVWPTKASYKYVCSNTKF